MYLHRSETKMSYYILILVVIIIPTFCSVKNPILNEDLRKGTACEIAKNQTGKCKFKSFIIISK